MHLNYYPSPLYFKSVQFPEQTRVVMSRRREKFVSLAEKRVVRAIKDLRLIGNLSNRSNYQYTAKDVEKITKTLENELRSLRRRFEVGGSKESVDFKL
jgi:transcription elongation GreA/GreB family factor